MQNEQRGENGGNHQQKSPSFLHNMELSSRSSDAFLQELQVVFSFVVLFLVKRK